jgi:Ca-activated chloride channel family protein
LAEAPASHLAAPIRLRLDPNGRYATTYRPGGAAQAAFEAAVARGTIPSAYHTLVGDFGARYAPPIAPPADGALAFRVDLGRARLPPDGGRVPLRIAIRSSAQHPVRARLSVHLVLDNSGSMAGEAIVNARRAAESLVERLADDDEFSLVVFSGNAHLLVDVGRVGPRRAQIAARIRAIGIDGSTNIAAGLDYGYAQARAHSDADAVRIVMLLSDGHGNIGDTDPAALAERAAGAFQDGIQTSAFGLGPDYDAALMSSIADQGAGGYYYLADSAQIAAAITRELDARLVPVAQAIELRVRLAPDVKPVKVYGSHQLDEREEASVRRQEVAVDHQTERRDGIARDRQRNDRGGMRFFIPAFARDDRHATLIELVVARGTGDRSLGTVEIRYKDRLRKENLVKEVPLHIGFAASAGESVSTIDRSVAATEEAFAAGDANLNAAEKIENGNPTAAIDRLNAATARLTSASLRFDDVRLSADARRLAALTVAVQRGATQPLPLAVLLRGSGYGYLH